ncbi:MAG TPA: D-alanine--D-alanine ligase family protein [Steroidobacteraceae bacterium]|nr:D-alanine--D-alanine ligase family protein [Steroidobacteraceae bacterium]
MTRKLRVGILFGGRAAEHEISILSARNVAEALDRTKFEPVLIGIDKSGRWLTQSESALLTSSRDPRLVKINEGTAVTVAPFPIARAEGDASFDVVFPVLHGPMGEDGAIQGLLELAGIPYVGAGVLGSAVGMDKDVMKRLLVHAGIPVPKFFVIHFADFQKSPDAVCRQAAKLKFPLFTKPANLGSSVGIRRVASRKELRAALAHAFEYDVKILAEEAIIGREIECSVLGDDDPIASIPGEIMVQHKDGFYSYDAKYVDEHGAVLKIPAALKRVTINKVQKLAIRVFQILESNGLARVDFFLTKRGRLLVNEINTLPGFTAISMYPKLWEASGLTQTELITRLIEIAIKRHERKVAVRQSYTSAG